MFNPFMSGLGMFGGYGGYRPPMSPMMGGMFGSPFGGMMGGYQRPSFGRPPMMGGFGGFGGYGSPFGGLGMFGMSPYGGMPNYGMFGGMMNPFMNRPLQEGQFIKDYSLPVHGPELEGLVRPADYGPNQLPADAVTTEYRPRVAAPFQQGPEAVDDGTLLSATSSYVRPAPVAPLNNRLPPLGSSLESKSILTDTPQFNYGKEQAEMRARK